MKIFLIISSLLALSSGMALGFLGNPAILAVGFFAFLALLIAANLDRIAEFKATSSGVEAKTRDVVQRAENAVKELHILALQVAELSLSLAIRQGRWGGYSDEDLSSMRESVFSVLKKLGISEKDSQAVLTEWHKFVEFDYASHILGGSTIPEDASNELLVEWKSLRGNGIAKFPSPQEIRQFLTTHGFISASLSELLIDYEHYQKHRNHRRPEVWRDRENWARLAKA